MRYIETYEVRRMTHSQESRVSSSQDTVPPREENRSNMSAMVNDINSCLRGDMVSNNDLKVEKMAATSNEDGKNSDSTCPWLANWGESCQHALGCRSSKKLENLMKKFLGYASSNVKECYTRPNRAAKLRKCIDETLVFFHLYYQDFHEPGKHSTYLNLMTELVSMYVDMEIKAASRRKERVKKITTRLIASLYIFLGKSEDHILDAILKTKLITKHNRDVCLPVLGKVVNQVPSPVNEMSYIRYLLIFKLYKKIAQNAEKGKQQKAEEGRRINKLAVLKLKPPPNFVEKAKMFTNVLPKIPPKSKKNITHFFMQAKFNLRSACTAFVKSASEFHTMLNGSASKELYSKSISMDLASKLECNAGSSNSSANDIWSSIELKSLVESFPLRNLNSEKTDIIGISKKVKEKVKKKNKKNKGMKSKEKDLEKIRKKKLKKNKILDSCGDTEPMLQNKLLESKKDKGKKRCLKNDATVMSCESTDESVSLPEINPTADSMNRDLGVLSNLSSNGLKNLLTAPGSSYSSESQKVGSTGVVLKQEKGNEKDVSDVMEVAAETSVSVSGCEHSSSSAATPVPTFKSRSNICTVAPPPPHPYSSAPLPPSHTPPSRKMPSTSSSQVGPHPYSVQHHASSHSDHTSHHPKHNSESLTSSPTKSSVLTSNSSHVSTSSLPSPHRNLPNICSGLPAGFTPSVPPPPLGHPPPSQHNMKCTGLDCYNNHLQYLSGPHSTRYLEHSDVSASFQPPLPSSPAPLRPPLPRSPAPPLPPLPSTPAPTSSAFPMHSMSVPPPSLALFSTIPPPPPPPALSHHISGHSSLSGIPVRPGHTHPTHLPPTHIPPTHPSQSTPPPVRPSLTPPPPPSIPPPPPPTPAPLATSTYSSPPFLYSQFSSLPVSHPPSTQVPSTSAIVSSAPSLNANSRNPSVIPVNVSSGNPPVSHTPPPRSRSISSPSPCTPSYAPTPPPSCTPTPPSPSCTPPSSPLYSHTRVSHSPSLTRTSTPPLHSANFPSQSSQSRPPPSSAMLSPSLTPTPPPPSVHPSPSPSHSPTQCPVTPPPSLHPSTAPSQSSTNVSTSTTRSLVVTLPSSNVSSQSISPSSPSQSCAVVFSTYTPASPSPSPSLCCSVSPSPSRSPSPCHSPSPSRSPSPSQSSFRRSPSICRSSSPSRSLSPSRSRTPLSSPVSRSQSPSTSPSPSYTPVCLSPHTPNPSPLCIPTPSSPLRNSTTPTSCATVSSVQPSIPSSMNSPVSKQSKPSESSLSSSPVQSPVHARSSTPVQHTSLASTSSHSSVSNTVNVTTVTTCTTFTTSVPTSTLSSRASSSPSVPSSSSPVHVSISCKSPSCSPIPSDVSSQTEVRADAAINVTLSVASPSQTPSSASPVTPPIPTPCIVEQPSTTTLLDSSAKVTQSSVELDGTQNDNKSKGPCDSSPALLDSVPVISCFTSSVASSEDRIEEVVAEVEVQAEDTETEVEADTLVSQVVEESQESVLTGTNSEQPVCEEVSECLSKMKVSCDSAGESTFLVEYSDGCEEVEPDMCIKEKMFEERYSHTNSVNAPVGQMRNTVIASGGPSGSAENTKYFVTSQICKTEVQQNEAIASCSVPEKVCLNAVSPRLDSDPLLVSRPIPNDSESKTVAYTCDSSIPSVSLIEGCSPANNEDLFQLPMDIGNLEETTSFVPGAARNDELLNEVITGNHLLFSLQNGFSIMALDVSARQEDPEPDSPAVEEFDERDRASISNLMMYFSGVHTADFSDFGRGRQDYVVPRDILESDEIEEEAEDTSPLSSDPHDKSFNISNSSVVDLDNHEYSRRHTKGEKHPAPGLSRRRYVEEVEERDGSDASPTSNVENDSIFSQNTLFSNDCIGSRRDRHCHVPESPKMNALGEVHIPHSSTPKRLPDVNFIRSMPNTLDSREDSSPEESPVKVSESSSSALSRAHLLANRTVEVRLNRDSVPGIIPDVVLDAHKAEGQREQEAPKAAPRGMLLDANVTRGKLSRPYGDSAYHGVPLQAGSIPSSIPYPAITTQVANGKVAPPVQNFINCACTDCYHNLLILSLNPGVHPIPLSFCHPHLETHTDKLKSAEKLKSEDEELLRKIEESLTKNKNLDEMSDLKYKPELDSSLPLKKRLKTLTAMSKIKSEPMDKWDNLKEDSFPSYPTKPMISIAELEYNEKLFSKHIQKPIKTVMSNNPQRFLPYAYFQPVQQGKEVNKFENELPQYSQYNAEVSSTVNIPFEEVPFYQLCPVNRESASEKNLKLQQSMQQFYFNTTSVTTTITNTMPTIKTTTTINNNHLNNRDKNKSSDLKNVTVKVESFPEIKVESSLMQQNPTVNSWEYSGRQFKTPAQLKELPAVDYYMGMPVMKYNGSKSESNPPPNTSLCVPKLNSIDEIKYGCSQFNKPHALDLSVEDPGNVKSQRNRMRKSNSAGETTSRSRSSKRNSKSQGVCQYSTTPNVYHATEKKMHRKQVSR